MTKLKTTHDSGTGQRRLRIGGRRRFYRYVRLRWRVMFALLDFFGWLAFGQAHILRRLLVRKPLEPRHVRTVLVIQLDHFGDGVLSLGLLRWLKDRFPAASLEVLCASWNQDLFAELSAADHVHVLDQTRFARSGGWRWVLALLVKAWSLRRRKYDLAIDVRGEFPHALAMRVTGARHRIGWNAGGGGFLLTGSVPFVPTRHEIKSRAAIAAQIAGKPVAAGDIAPRIEPRARQHSSRVLAGKVTVEPGAIALHIGAGTAAKMWSADSWIDLVTQLSQQLDRQILLLGGKGEQSLAERITADHATGSVCDLTGKLTIRELPNVFADCRVLVGADSGPAHLAASCGLPVIALFSGTNHPQQWSPWGDHVRILKHDVACSPCHREVCPLADHPCLTGITAQRVLAEIESALEQNDGLKGRIDSRTTRSFIENVTA